MKLTRVVSFFIVITGKLALAVTNPVPLINQPLVPMTAAPGGPAFKLTVNGTGFVSTSIVHWNGVALTTTFVTSSQLTASVPASDIANAGTASVTVVSPAPGGGTSNPVSFDIASPASTLTFASFFNIAHGGGLAMTTADFNGDGKPDLAQVSNHEAASGLFVDIQLSNGDGSFQLPVAYAVGRGTGQSLIVGDFNGDGKIDIAVPNQLDSTVSVLLGNGDGTFQPQVTFATAIGPTFIVAGDFNGDGKLDLVTGDNNTNGDDNGHLSVLLGNGDGTFQSHVEVTVGGFIDAIVVGDFNGDGKLDLACARSAAGPSGISILLGNGDGTFAAPSFTATAQPAVMTTADLNGDGALDLILVIDNSPGSVNILLGKGDGTFQAGQSVATQNSATSVAVGDLNADGKLDVAVANANSNSVSLFLGNGDGTFQTAIDIPANLPNFSNSPLSLSIADFNGDGLMDLAVLNANGQNAPPLFLTLTVLLQGTLPAAVATPPSLTFGQQAIGTTSAPQTATLTNSGTATLTLSSIGITGANAGDFAETNGCSATLSPNASCQINVTFSPKAPGSKSAVVNIASNGPGGPQVVALTGTTPPTPVASLSPLTVAFPNQFVGTSGMQQNVTVTNTGTAALNITKVAASPGDFGVLNACGSSLAAGSSCSIGVFFDPTATGTRTGQLTVTDDASDSPQTVQLSGTGQDFSLAPSSSASATVAAGQTATYTIAVSPGGGFNQNVTLSCSGAPVSSTCSVSPASVVISGSNPTSVTVTVTTRGGGRGVRTPAGTYTLNVTGTCTSGSSTLTHTTPLTLVVR